MSAAASYSTSAICADRADWKASRGTYPDLRCREGPDRRISFMRDTKIDVLRGLAIFTITLNHFTWLASDLGLEARAFPTLTQFGFSSSAEIFFLLSGYLVGQVYTGIYRKYGLARMVGKCLDRAYKLYVYNLILLGVCVAITAVAAPGVAQV